MESFESISGYFFSSDLFNYFYCKLLNKSFHWFGLIDSGFLSGEDASDDDTLLYISYFSLFKIIVPWIA